MNQFIDIEIHQEPMATAVILNWLAESHAKARDPQEGILIPWAILGVGLVSTESTLKSLPSNKQTFFGWLRSDGARSWRGYLKPIILAWKDTFWTALAYGEVAGIIALQDGRLIAKGHVKTPDSQGHSGVVRRKARAIGGTFGGEQEDQRIASALGLEFEE